MVNFSARYQVNQGTSLLDLLIIDNIDDVLSVKDLPPPGHSDWVCILSIHHLFPPRKHKFVRHVFIDYFIVSKEVTDSVWSFIEKQDVVSAWSEMRTLLLETFEKQ